MIATSGGIGGKFRIDILSDVTNITLYWEYGQYYNIR